MAGDYKTPDKLNDLFKEYDEGKNREAEEAKTRRGEEEEVQALCSNRMAKEIIPVLEAFAASLKDAGHYADVDVDMPRDHGASAALSVRPSKGGGYQSKITFRCTHKGEVVARGDLPNATSQNRKVEDVKADWVEDLVLQHVQLVLKVR